MDRALALEVLGLTGEAAGPEAQARYRQLAKTVHPDVGGSSWLFQQVSEAYQVLTGGAPVTQPKEKVRCTKQDILGRQDFTLSFNTFLDLLKHPYWDFPAWFRGVQFKLNAFDVISYNPAVELSVDAKAVGFFTHKTQRKKITYKGALLGDVEMPTASFILSPGVYRVQVAFADTTEKQLSPKTHIVLVLPGKCKTIEAKADLSSFMTRSKLTFPFLCKGKNGLCGN